MAEQAPAVLSLLCLLPIFPGGSVDTARDGKGPEPRAWWTGGGKNGPEIPVSIHTRLSPVPRPGHGGQGRLLRASQSSLGGRQLPTSFLFSYPLRRPCQGFPFSWADETTPATPCRPNPGRNSGQELRASEGFEIWMRPNPSWQSQPPFTEHEGVRSSSPAARGTPTQLPG